MAQRSEMIVGDAGIKANPYPLYARMRAEAPVCSVLYAASRSRVWMVTRYEDVVTVLKVWRLSNDPRKREAPGTVRSKVLSLIFARLVNNMLNSDQPDHPRLRALVHQAFTPKRIEELRQRIQALTYELLERASSKGNWDVVSDYAVPIPATIIAEMLGVPLKDRERFGKWSNALLLSSATRWKGIAGNAPRFMAFLRYVRALVKARRNEPQDDLISALVAAEEAGNKLTEDELVSMVFLLLIAGYETTMNLIGSGTLALIENPGEMGRLRAHPDMMGTAIEEFVRYYSPLEFAQARYTLSEVELAGAVIPKGEAVIAAISSANRDEKQFDRPDVLDLAREPNRHLGFGVGAHYCLGAPLARLEAHVAFTNLIRRFAELRLAAPRQDLRWRQSTLLRGLESLPVETVPA